MNNILDKYYRGITQQLRAEVDLINSLFQHQGVKGSGNEEILRELLRRFIPRRYGVGTGVVIDRLGNQSRQSDIIIYDTLLYPSLLSLATVHLFPVDIVYATIEVKTTLNSSSVADSLTNILSVKDLDIIKESFIVPESRKENFSLVSYTPEHPLGFIFAYNSDALQFETFKNWFYPDHTDDVTKYPVLVGCLDQGLVLFTDLYPNANSKPEAWLVSLMTKLGDGTIAPKIFTQQTESFLHEGLAYPVKKFNSSYIAIDQSRILLLFIMILNEMLAYRRLNPSISFVNEYLTEAMRFHYTL